MSDWSLRRAVYFGLGTLMVVHSIIDRMWIGVLFGAYFAAMGLFGFGCANGLCTLQESGHTSVRKDGR